MRTFVLISHGEEKKKKKVLKTRWLNLKRWRTSYRMKNSFGAGTAD
jgi:hypothetical protein